MRSSVQLEVRNVSTSRESSQVGRIQSNNVTGSLLPTVPLRQLVVERIRRQIVTGELRPGQHLVETELAASLGVSRGPIREALQTLAHEGWVELQPRRGAFVHEPSAGEVEQFFHARQLLETETAFLAAQGFTEGRHGAADTMLEILDEAEKAIQTPGELDVTLLTDIDNAFHREVANLSGNNVLANLLSHIAKRAQWYYAPLVTSRAKLAHLQHRDIVKALLSGQADKAGGLMRAHVDGTKIAYRRLAADLAVPDSEHAPK